MENKDIERFWEKVERKEGGCWTWTACKDKKGYGRFRLEGKMVLSHRLAWKIENGDIPEGLHVLHICDRPPCVNPKHLFLGTNADNVADKVVKGRQSRLKGKKNPMYGRTGEKHPMFGRTGKKHPMYGKGHLIQGERHGRAKLDANTVLIIRRVYEREEGATYRELSDLYGVSRPQICDIVNRKQWSHIK